MIAKRQLVLIAGVVLLSGVVFVLTLFSNRPAAPPDRPTASAAEPPRPMRRAGMSTPYLMPGILRPPTTPADEAKLADDAEVIGVSAAGRHRAYVLSAFTGPARHVVNDLLGDLPVTVTHCDQTHCTRVFHGEPKGDALTISVGGLWEGRLLVRSHGRFYDQETGASTAPGQEPLPYPAHPFEITTWKAWKTAHPDTDAYLGFPEEIPHAYLALPDGAKN
jgi:Protein of unknown function (DUF3179)